jgi:flagellar motor switch protein FliN/FliY
MSQDVDFEQLTSDGVNNVRLGPESGADLRRLSAVPVELSVEIGRCRMSVGETLELREGSVVTLDRMAGEPVDLLVNGTPIARGEVVVIDEQFGLRLTQVLTAGPSGEQTDLPDSEPGAPVAPEPIAG